MGLDMDALVTATKPKRRVDFREPNDRVLIHSWRKHPNLHGWMEWLYRAKAGREFFFNCVTLQLTSVDLDLLETSVRGNKLPLTEGFFFGRSDGSTISLRRCRAVG